MDKIFIFKSVYHCGATLGTITLNIQDISLDTASTTIYSGCVLKQNGLLSDQGLPWSTVVHRANAGF